ncbi:MAG TPA: hypothetical protein VHC19_11200 [Pirellulales bacterium]|jgi:hypothetical protein|nr:hypothetical protein [Pirellulales bacterium]
MPEAKPDFGEFSWHDCHIWAIAFQPGNPNQGDWTSDLALDIDFICQWLCDDGGCRFRVAPAMLVFHDVSDARIAIAWERTSYAHELSIAEIVREPLAADETGLAQDKPSYRWIIKFNWPEGGELSFIASGFTQTLNAEPVLLDEQSFSLATRNALLKR